MRYLTHESEDAYWIQQGAKPHPLITKRQQKYMHHTYNNILILEEPRPGAPSIATTTAIAKPQTTKETKMKAGGQESYVDLPDKELEQREQHAKRVGYTVSTV